MIENIVNILVVPSVFLYYWFNSKRKSNLILFALFFAWCGNLFLLIDLQSDFQNDIINAQKSSVFCFWLMNIFFFRYFINFNKNYFFREHVLGLVFYFSYLIVFLKHVYSSLGDMKIYGLVYGVTMVIFGSFTVMLLFKRVNKIKFLMFLGLLFISIKDVMLTYNKRFFKEEVFAIPIPVFQCFGLFLMIWAFIQIENKYQKQSLSNSQDTIQT